MFSVIVVNIIFVNYFNYLWFYNKDKYLVKGGVERGYMYVV